MKDMVAVEVGDLAGELLVTEGQSLELGLAAPRA